MPDDAKPPESVNLTPRCPYCKADPITINCREIAFNNGIAAVLFICANPECRKLLPVAFSGRVQPHQNRIEPAVVVPRIVKPS